MEHTDSVRDVFDSAILAAAWPRWADPSPWLTWLSSWWPSFSPSLVPRPRLVAALAVRPSDTVCVVGPHLAPTLSTVLAAVPEGRVVGVSTDADDAACVARGNRAHVRQGRLSIVEGSAQPLPVPDGSCDAVLALANSPASQADWPWTHPPQELARVLREAGRLVALGPDPGPGLDGCIEALRDVGFAVAIDEVPGGPAVVVASQVPAAPAGSPDAA